MRPTYNNPFSSPGGRSPQPKRMQDAHPHIHKSPPPLDSLHIISSSRNKLLSTLTSPRVYHTYSKEKLAGRLQQTTPRKKAGELSDALLETPKDPAKSGVCKTECEDSLRCPNWLKKKYIENCLVPIKEGDDHRGEIEKKIRFSITTDKSSSINIMKKASIARQKHVPNSGDEGKWDGLEQGVIPSNPSVQQETGQKFYSEESDKCQIITELSDYTGETIGNNEGTDLVEQRMERLNTEQINEGVIYSTGGVGVIQRNYHSNRNNNASINNKERVKYGINAPKVRFDPVHSSSPGQCRPKKCIMMKDLSMLQKEILDRKVRMRLETHTNEENYGSILDSVEGPSGIDDQAIIDHEAGSRVYQTARGPVRTEFGLNVQKLPASRNNAHNLTARYMTERQYRPTKATADHTAYQDTGKSMTVTQEDIPSAKRIDKITLEQDANSGTVLFFTNDKSVKRLTKLIGILLLFDEER